MNLLLLRSERGSLVPLAQARHSAPDQPPPDAGLWTRTRARVASAYEALKERLDYYEKICADLRGAQSLRVIHPVRWEADEAREDLKRFFQDRRRHHLRWFQVDVALAILGGFLMPLPGPNLFFFYPAARAFGHYHARQGAAAALECRPWRLESDRRLDQVEERLGQLGDIAKLLRELQEEYGVAHLEKSLNAVRKR